jgi:hypothetical protein
MKIKVFVVRFLAVIFTLLLLPSGSSTAAPPSIAGCRIFPVDNIWNRPVDNLPVSPSSSSYINSIGASTGLHPDFGSGTWEGAPIGIPLTIVSGTQPKVLIAFGWPEESDPGPYPIPTDALIEGGSESQGDRHVLVLDRDSCKLYELYSAYPQLDGSWEAGSGAVYDLFSNRLRPRGWTSADAAGLPILPGLARYQEVADGEITHALRFTAQNTRNEYVWPARHRASDITNATTPPLGQRFRLKSEFNITGFSPQVQVILRALKKYGLILADNGSDWFITGMPDPGWDNDHLSQLGQVKGADFEAVDGTAPMIGMDFARTMATLNPAPPLQPARLIFIHHSTGQNWLADENGGLGIALRDNNYFVSDTNYGWGPDSIGDHTDIGNWWEWFRGPGSAAYLASLYSESGQHSSYSRLATTPVGSNEIIMFKSCFPNSALRGGPDDPVPDIGNNPLKGVSSGSVDHNVANAKGIYLDLLNYFSAHQEKLFVVITAPPLSDPTYAANARAFNDWLVNEWLADYPYRNVAVFDFYNILTTNGGNANTSDLGSATGNHHRWWQGGIQHKTDGDNDPNPNVLEFSSGDDHPSQAGNLKASGEFVTMLNIFYHNWKDADITPPPLSLTEPLTPTITTSQTIGGTTEAGATVTVTTDTPASDGQATVIGTNWSYTITGLAAGPNGITVTARDGANNATVRNSSITRNPALTVSVTGSGGGSITGGGGEINCGSDCSAFFDFSSIVSLTANPDRDSVFGGWSGNCTATDNACSVNMDRDQAASATFNHVQPVRIKETHVEYQYIHDAYGVLDDGGTIQTRQLDLTEVLVLDRDIAANLQGGFTASYASNAGQTFLTGSVTLVHGSLTLENIAIQ